MKQTNILRALCATLFVLLLGASDLILAANLDYVGVETCKQCHENETMAWRGSHHDLAMQAADTGTVLGSFDDAEFEYYGHGAGRF